MYQIRKKVIVIERYLSNEVSFQHDVAVLGTSCPDRNSNSDMEAYREIKSTAMIMSIQLIFQQILAKCNGIHDFYKLWTYLKSQYYSDSPFSFVH